jgi:hypothetical protein
MFLKAQSGHPVRQLRQMSHGMPDDVMIMPRNC